MSIDSRSAGSLPSHPLDILQHRHLSPASTAHNSTTYYFKKTFISDILFIIGVSSWPRTSLFLVIFHQIHINHPFSPFQIFASMQAYYPSSAAHSHLVFSNSSRASMQAYYPSTAAHTHLDNPIISTTDTPPPSPTAAELIAALQNPENLSDEDLLKAALNAQSALTKWQDEYLDNDREIRRETTGLFNKRKEPKARQLQDPKAYERSRDKAAQDATTTQATSSRGRKLTKTANANSSQPAKQPAPKTRKPRTTVPKRPQPPKPTASGSSKPKTTIPRAPSAPKPTTSGSSQPRMTRSKTPQAPKAAIANPPKPKAPASKRPQPPKPTTSSSSKPKTATKTPSQPPNPTTPPTAPLPIPKDLLIDMNAPQPAQITGKRTRVPRKIFDSAPLPPPKAAISRSATPSLAPKKRARTVDVEEEPAAKKQRAESVGAGAERSKGDVMREVWARRRAEGRSGRYGGKPKVATVKKAGKREGR